MAAHACLHIALGRNGSVPAVHLRIGQEIAVREWLK